MRGVAANCAWPLTVSDLAWNAALFLRPVLRLSKLAKSLPANPLHECWNKHATNASEVKPCLRYSLDPELRVSTSCHDLFVCSAPRQARQACNSVYNYQIHCPETSKPYKPCALKHKPRMTGLGFKVSFSFPTLLPQSNLRSSCRFN